MGSPVLRPPFPSSSSIVPLDWRNPGHRAEAAWLTAGLAADRRAGREKKLGFQKQDQDGRWCIEADNVGGAFTTLESSAHQNYHPVPFRLLNGAFLSHVHSGSGV
jgi:hypothetical protein